MQEQKQSAGQSDRQQQTEADSVRSALIQARRDALAGKYGQLNRRARRAAERFLRENDPSWGQK